MASFVFFFAGAFTAGVVTVAAVGSSAEPMAEALFFLGSFALPSPAGALSAVAAPSAPVFLTSTFFTFFTSAAVVVSGPGITAGTSTTVGVAGSGGTTGASTAVGVTVAGAGDWGTAAFPTLDVFFTGDAPEAGSSVDPAVAAFAFLGDTDPSVVLGPADLAFFGETDAVASVAADAAAFFGVVVFLAAGSGVATGGAASTSTAATAAFALTVFFGEAAAGSPSDA